MAEEKEGLIEKSGLFIFIFIYVFILIWRFENLFKKDKALLEFRKYYFAYLVNENRKNLALFEQVSFEPFLGFDKVVAEDSGLVYPRKYTSYGLLSVTYRGIRYEQAQLRNILACRMGRSDAINMAECDGTLLRIPLNSLVTSEQVGKCFAGEAMIHHKNPDCTFCTTGKVNYGEEQSKEFQKLFEVFTTNQDSVFRTGKWAKRLLEIQSHISSQLELRIKNGYLYVLICRTRSPYTVPIIRSLEDDVQRTWQYLCIPQKLIDALLDEFQDTPIYEQIEIQIKNLIINGELKEGDALPSMRLLAKELRISIITTKRAYEDLERDGFIESYTGRGSFVKAINRERARETTIFELEQLLLQAIEKAKGIGFDAGELKERIDILYEQNKYGGQ